MKKDEYIEIGEGDIIVDFDLPSRTVADEYIEDIKELREKEYLKSEAMSVTKIRFKGLDDEQ